MYVCAMKQEKKQFYVYFVGVLNRLRTSHYHNKFAIDICFKI